MPENGTAEITLAEALLRRKELESLIKRLDPVRPSDLFTTRLKRVKITDDLDEVTAQIPRIKAEQIDQYHNWLARQLRFCDAAIQRANWDTTIKVKASVVSDFESKGFEDDPHPAAVN